AALSQSPRAEPQVARFAVAAVQPTGGDAATEQNSRVIRAAFGRRLRSVVRPADGSAGMAGGGSGHADTPNSGPTRAAAVSDLRDHAVRLRSRRGRYCLCRSCDGYDKPSSSNQPDHSSPPFFGPRRNLPRWWGLSRRQLSQAIRVYLKSG